MGGPGRTRRDVAPSLLSADVEMLRALSCAAAASLLLLACEGPGVLRTQGGQGTPDSRGPMAPMVPTVRPARPGTEGPQGPQGETGGQGPVGPEGPSPEGPAAYVPRPGFALESSPRASRPMAPMTVTVVTATSAASRCPVLEIGRLRVTFAAVSAEDSQTLLDAWRSYVLCPASAPNEAVLQP